MPFPEQPRVKYQNNPLVDVVCQWVFSGKTSGSELNAVSAAEIHEKIREQFPLFNIAKIVSVEVNPQNQSLNQFEEEQYEYRSADSSKKIDITKNRVTLTTTMYTSWEEFRGDFLSVVDLGIKPIFGDIEISRVGLRYKDIIERSSIQLTEASWDELITPYLSSFYSKENAMANHVVGEQSKIVLSLPENEGRLNITYGLVTNSNTQEQCFLLDSDFYIEGKLDDSAAREFMDRYNIKARNFFRWSITDKLHNLLQPTEVG